MASAPPVTTTNAKWADIEVQQFPNQLHSVQVGDQIPLYYYFQTPDSNATVQWYFDPDQNPTNPNAIAVGSPYSLADSNNTVASVLGPSFSLTVSGVTPNQQYFILAAITDNGLTRYSFVPGSFYFTAAPPPAPSAPHITYVTPSLSGMPLPQTQPFTIDGSGFTTDCVLQFSDGTNTYGGRIPAYVSPTELTYNIKVGDVTADWTVEVFNPDTHAVSNFGYFHVQSSGNTTAPGAPIDLTATPTDSSNEFFTVDWTNPADPSGLGTVWWKLGSPPTSNTDGNSAPLPDYQPLPIDNVAQQATTLYVWLQDGAGNANSNNYASVALPGNSSAPVLTISNPVYSTNYPVINLSGTITDAFGTVVSMAWANGLGGSGSVDVAGTGWTAPPIQLFAGANTIAFAAFDDHSNLGYTTITINYVPPAITDTWTGAVSNAWSNANNWSALRVPRSSDFVAINGGVVNVTSGLNVAGLFLYGGTMNWTGGTIYGTFDVATGATLTISALSSNLYTYGTINNYGTIVQNCYAGHNFGPSMINNLSGATYDLQSGLIWYLSVNDALNNAGLLEKSTNANGDSSLKTPLNNFDGTIEVGAGTLHVDYGETNTGGATIVAAGAILDLEEDTFIGSATYTGLGTVEMQRAWSVPGCQAIFDLTGGGLQIGELVLEGGTLINAGFATWLSGYIEGGGTYYGNLYNTGTLIISPTGSDIALASAGALTNAGTIVQNGGNGYSFDLTSSDCPINNLPGATYELEGGTLNVEWGGITGGIDISAGGTLNLEYPTISGEVDVAAGGTLNWTGGTINGNVNLASGASLIMTPSGASYLYLAGVLNNGGTVVQNGGLFLNGSTINNLAGGTYDFQNGTINSDYGTGVFNNASLLESINANGNSSLAIPFDNTGNVQIDAGTLIFSDAYLQASGGTILAGGDLSGNLQIQGGSLSGYGTITGSVTNSGIVSPGMAGLLIIGNYAQTATGQLQISIAGTQSGQYGELSVAGSDSLAGNIAGAVSYAPLAGDTFVALSGGSISGLFFGVPEGSTVILGGFSFRISYQGYNGHAVTLTALPPEIDNVYVRGTAWTSSVLDSLAAAGQGDPTFGYRIPTGSPAQMTDLPWGNINEISVAFSENVTVSQASLALSGLNPGTYSFSNFSYDPTSHVATWTLARAPRHRQPPNRPRLVWCPRRDRLRRQRPRWRLGGRFQHHLRQRHARRRFCLPLQRPARRRQPGRPDRHPRLPAHGYGLRHGWDAHRLLLGRL